jgi:chemotaxis response regulator CheB
MSKKIRVVLIEDSLIALQILQRLLEDSQEVEVVGTAQDGAAGLELIGKVNPDVICTDLVMPRMDGLEFTKKVMELYPRPILVISNVVHPTDVDNIYNLMQAGALDFFPKPDGGSPSDYQKLQHVLVTKIKALARKGIK